MEKPPIGIVAFSFEVTALPLNGIIGIMDIINFPALEAMYPIDYLLEAMYPTDYYPHPIRPLW